MSNNRIWFSNCGKFLEVWNGGTKVHIIPLCGNLHESVDQAKRWIKAWTGDDEPRIAKEVQVKLDAIDAMVSQLAFAGEYK